MKSLEEIATYIVSDGKGILAADESTPTIGKRFATINAESTEDSRRDYREMLFRADGMKNNIGGVILFDETLRQDAKDGTPLKDIISEQGALPGIKVDKGISPLDSSPEENITGGLEGLNERCAEYFDLGAKFTKWRAVIKIADGLPSQAAIKVRRLAAGRYTLQRPGDPSGWCQPRTGLTCASRRGEAFTIKCVAHCRGTVERRELGEDANEETGSEVAWLRIGT